MNNLNAKKQLDEAIQYIRKSVNYIYVIIGLFIISSIIGITFRSQLGFLDEILRQIIDKTTNLNGTEMIFFILQNNLQSALISIVFGIALGIFPIFSAISNGLIIGYVLGKSSEIIGAGIWWRLLPHGIFELPAIFISFGLSLKLGFSFFNTNWKKTFLNRIYNTANVFLLIVIPLLIIAATIEGILIFLI